MSDTEKRRGRQEEYTDARLDEILIDFTTKNPIKNLNLSQLEKQTGISRKTWLRRKKEKIESLRHNNIQIDLGGSGDKNFIIFEDVVKLVEKNWNNKKAMIRDFKIYQEVSMSFYEMAKKAKEMEERAKKYNKEIIQLKEQLKVARKDVEYYKDQYLSVTVRSASIASRQEEGLKDVLGVDSKSKESLDKVISLDFGKKFPELFE